MKSTEKIYMIEKKVEQLNEGVLKNKSWKLKHINRGANNYCLVIIKDNKEVFNGSFNTYDSELSCLYLLLTMFSKELNDLTNK